MTLRKSDEAIASSACVVATAITITKLTKHDSAIPKTVVGVTQGNQYCNYFIFLQVTHKHEAQGMKKPYNSYTHHSFDVRRRMAGDSIPRSRAWSWRWGTMLTIYWAFFVKIIYDMFMSLFIYSYFLRNNEISYISPPCVLAFEKKIHSCVGSLLDSVAYVKRALLRNKNLISYHDSW